MKKCLTAIALLTLPILTFGQNTSNDEPYDINLIKHHLAPVAINLESAKKQIHFTPTFITTRETLASYRKSRDLVSIKAYQKSLQIKIKEVVVC